MRFWLCSWLGFILITFTGCGGAAETPPLQSSSATQTPTQVAQPSPTASATVGKTPAATEITASTPTVDWLAVEGKTADNLFYLGNPDASVTVIDYSDFL